MGGFFPQGERRPEVRAWGQAVTAEHTALLQQLQVHPVCPVHAQTETGADPDTEYRQAPQGHFPQTEAGHQAVSVLYFAHFHYHGRPLHRKQPRRLQRQQGRLEVLGRPECPLHFQFLVGALHYLCRTQVRQNVARLPADSGFKIRTEFRQAKQGDHADIPAHYLLDHADHPRILHYVSGGADKIVAMLLSFVVPAQGPVVLAARLQLRVLLLSAGCDEGACEECQVRGQDEEGVGWRRGDRG